MIRYLVIFSLLLVTEIAIAVYHFHAFVRGFIGDVLVIPLLYTFFRVFTKTKPKHVLIGVLFLAFSIEFLQLFSLPEKLNINNTVVLIVFGSTFDPLDLVAYLFGILPVLFIEKILHHGKD